MMSINTELESIYDALKKLDESNFSKIALNYGVSKIWVYSSLKEQLTDIANNFLFFDTDYLNGVSSNTIINLYSFFDQSLFNLIKNFVFNLKPSSKIYLHETSVYLAYLVKNGMILFEINGKSIILTLYHEKKVYYIKENKGSFFIRDTTRILRHIVISALINQGGVLLHAGGISYYQNGICILGKSGSGKTTTLLGTLIADNVDMISNDKVILLMVNSKIYIIAIPFSVRILPTTISGYSFFKKGLEQLYPQKYLEFKMLEKDSLNNRHRKIELSNMELLNLINKPTSYKNVSPLYGFIFSNYQSYFTNNECIKSDNMKLAECIGRNVIYPINFGVRDWTGLLDITVSQYKKNISILIEELNKRNYPSVLINGTKQMYNFFIQNNDLWSKLGLGNVCETLK